MKQGWSFLNLWRKPLSLSVNCWRGGVPIEGEQEGKARPLEARRGWGYIFLIFSNSAPQYYGGAN